MKVSSFNYSASKRFSLIKTSQNICLFLSSLLFIISLFLPTFFTSGNDIYGIWVLISGWIGLAFLQLAWYANPLSLLALLVSRKSPKNALLLSMFALILASGSFYFYEIPTGINYEKVYIKELGFGFYLWFMAHIFVFLRILLSSIEHDVN